MNAPDLIVLDAQFARSRRVRGARAYSFVVERSRSSCCRSSRTSAKRFACSNSALTTTSSNRSEFRNCWHEARPRCAGICAAPIEIRWCKAGPLAIDLVSRVVTLDGRARAIDAQRICAPDRRSRSHAGLVVTHQQLIGEIWGNHAGNIQYLRILVRKLRQKIEVDATRPLLIVSKSGVGLSAGSGRAGVARSAR